MVIKKFDPKNDPDVIVSKEYGFIMCRYCECIFVLDMVKCDCRKCRFCDCGVNEKCDCIGRFMFCRYCGIKKKKNAKCNCRLFDEDGRVYFRNGEIDLCNCEGHSGRGDRWD